MKVFTYSEARHNFSDLLIIAQKEEVEIRIALTRATS